MADAPQYISPDADLQHISALQPGLEVLPQKQTHLYKENESAQEPREVVAEPKTIAGLRRRTFWIVIILTLIAVAIAAIGAATGGWVAARKGRHVMSSSYRNLFTSKSSFSHINISL